MPLLTAPLAVEAAASLYYVNTVYCKHALTAHVLKSGTLGDKISALTMRCKESPVHRLADLDKLVEMATKHDRRTAQMAQEALKDLFVSDLLPDTRRLQPFRERPLLQIEAWGSEDPATAARTLLLWYYEGELLRRFGALVGSIEAACKDTVANTKRYGMEAARDLLEAKPTGEAQLLSILVNKFGDPDRKVSSKAIHLLQLVLRKHTAMRAVMVREVQQYLHRPGLAPKALYAGVIFLNQ
eukprot:12258-Heterococcus_DN1.PRE.4